MRFNEIITHLVCQILPVKSQQLSDKYTGAKSEIFP